MAPRLRSFQGAQTIWAPFKAESDYFKPSDSDFMMNLMVDDLDGMIARDRGGGLCDGRRAHAGKLRAFCLVMDPDGRKVELWQPGRAG